MFSVRSGGVCVEIQRKMAKTIYKYELPIVDQVVLVMPKGAIPLCVQAQGDDLQLWAMVDPKAPMEERKFRIIGTGHPIPDSRDLVYIDTVQVRINSAYGGVLVWHVFESRPRDSMWIG